MDITFKNSILISFLIHCAVIFPLYSVLNVNEEAKKKDSIVIDYIVVEEPKKSMLKTADTPELELKSKVDVKPAPLAPPAPQPAAEDREASRELAQRQADARSTKDYVNYYQLIREKIRQKVKGRYRSYYNEGDVYLSFVLNQDGSLAGCDVEKALSTSDRALHNIATSSLREAAPFPPFPKALSLPKMFFNLTVSFKKE